MRTIGIYMRNGEIERVTTDDRAGAHVVVFQGGNVEKLMQAEYEAAITEHVLVARAKTQGYGVALALEMAGDQLVELSKNNHGEPLRYVRDAEKVMAVMLGMINKALGRPTARAA